MCPVLQSPMKESVIERRRILAVLGLTVATAVWGGGYVATDIALAGLTPMRIMAVRFLIGAVAMALIAVRELPSATRREIGAGVCMGVALFCAFAFQTFGLQYTTASKNAFLTALNVVMVPFIAFVALRKRIGWQGIVGAVMSVVGVAVLSLDGDLGLGLGDGLTLLGAAGFAFQIFLTGLFVRRYRATVLNCVQMATACALSFAVMLASGQTGFVAPASSWRAVIYLGLVSTTFCYLLQTACQRYVDETKSAIILSLESVFGTLFSIALLHEVVTGRMVAGCAIILMAVLVSNMAGAGDAAVNDGAPGNGVAESGVADAQHAADAQGAAAANRP